MKCIGHYVEHVGNVIRYYGKHSTCIYICIYIYRERERERERKRERERERNIYEIYRTSI